MSADRCSCQHGRDHDGSEFGPCPYCENQNDQERINRCLSITPTKALTEHFDTKRAETTESLDIPSEHSEPRKKHSPQLSETKRIRSDTGERSNAPTTRETADHADHIGDATTMIDHAELARLAEAAMRVRRDAVGRLDGGDAVRIWGAFLDAMTPAVCSALLSEIAALRGERDGLKNRVSCLERLCGEQSTRVMEQATRAKDAERQRDELRKAADAMMPLLTLIEEGLWEDCPYPDVQAKRIASLRTQIANQGADQ